VYQRFWREEIEIWTSTFCPTLRNFYKGWGENVWKFTIWSITQPKSVRRRSDLVQGMKVQHPIYIKRSNITGSKVTVTVRRNWGKTVAKLSTITQPKIVRFRSNLEQSLNRWDAMYSKRSRSRGQRSRSQHDITTAKFAKSSITQQRIVRFRSHLLQTLITWHPFKVRYQKSRSQRENVIWSPNYCLLFGNRGSLNRMVMAKNRRSSSCNAFAIATLSS